LRWYAVDVSGLDGRLPLYLHALAAILVANFGSDTRPVRTNTIEVHGRPLGPFRRRRPPTAPNRTCDGGMRWWEMTR
jgi:hypothetical protein